MTPAPSTAVAPRYLHAFRCAGTACVDPCALPPVSAAPDAVPPASSRSPAGAVGYPLRYVKRTSGLGAWASLGCPEAARLALLDPAGLAPAGAGATLVVPHAVPIAAEAPARPDLLAAPLAGLADAIFHTAGWVLHHPGGRGTTALAVVGRMVGGLRRSPDARRMLAVLRRFQQRDTVATMIARAGVLPMAGRAQLALLRAMRDDAAAAPPGDWRDSVASIVAAFDGLVPGGPAHYGPTLDGPGVGDAVPDDGPAATRIAEARERLLGPLEADMPHLLANLALNDMGRTLFPLDGGDDLVERYRRTALLVALARLSITGTAAAAPDAFDASVAVRAVQRVARRAETDPALLARAASRLDAAGFGGLAGAIAALR
jgi:hypothetical protein